MAKQKTKLPVTRTLEYLESRGWRATRVDRKISPRCDRDFFGIADVLGLHPDGAILAVQCTDHSSVSKRVKKLESDDLAENMAALRNCNIAVQIWGWYPDRDVPRIVDLS